MSQPILAAVRWTKIKLSIVGVTPMTEVGDFSRRIDTLQHAAARLGQGLGKTTMDIRVTELHCIMPIQNVASVLLHGILSHERVAQLPHCSVAMAAMQDRRHVKTVPGGLRLHQYANLYFHARNPMLSVRRGEDVCVLRVSVQVLDINRTVITDQNAASSYVRFYAPNQWQLLNFDDIYARDWKHPDDQIQEWRHKSRKCAEVLVPHRVPSDMIVGAYVVDEAARARLNETGFSKPIVVDADFFFR